MPNYGLKFPANFVLKPYGMDNFMENVTFIQPGVARGKKKNFEFFLAYVPPGTHECP